MSTPRRSARVRNQRASTMPFSSSSMLLVNLLNPHNGNQQHQQTLPRNLSSTDHSSDIGGAASAQHVAPFVPTGVSKKEKDMPTYRRQAPMLPVFYPPHESEEGSETFRVQMDHSLFPTRDIAAHAAHIPYSSSRTRFREKTGRTAVEVFMYEFRMPLDTSLGRKRYVVYWDYNYGLVRMTNIYKACGLAKIVPRKALQANAGLLEISHSLTGGNLEAQGYWVPFEAAKALAAKFAFPIRHLLVPIFGPEFPNICVLPTDAEYRDYKIDATVVARCRQDAARWTSQGTVARAISAPLESDPVAETQSGITNADTAPSSPDEDAVTRIDQRRVIRGTKRSRAVVHSTSTSASLSSNGSNSIWPILPSSTASTAPPLEPAQAHTELRAVSPSPESTDFAQIMTLPSVRTLLAAWPSCDHASWMTLPPMLDQRWGIEARHSGTEQAAAEALLRLVNVPGAAVGRGKRCDDAVDERPAKRMRSFL